MKKPFHMQWRTITNGVPTDGKFIVYMTQEQWESHERLVIVNEALAKMGLTTKANSSANAKYCVTSENKPKRSLDFHQEIVEAICKNSVELFALDKNRFYEIYASLFDQENRKDGSVSVRGVDFYFRFFNGSGLCSYAEMLVITDAVKN